MIKGICFDLFHTLVDVGQVPDHIGRYTADILGIDREQWNRACFSHEHDITRPTSHYDSVKKMARSLNPAIPEALIQAAVSDRQARFDHSLTVVADDVLNILGQLRAQGYRLALISNASSGEVHAWPRSPLATLFDSAIFSCDVGARKPQADIYHAALNSLGLEASQCLFVGDGGSDEHVGAGRVGLQCVLITQYLNSAVKLQQQRRHVRWEIDHITRLPQLLDGLNGL